MTVSCPQCCEAIYSSVSGLKAHLASCSKVSPQGPPHIGHETLPLCPIANPAQHTLPSPSPSHKLVSLKLSCPWGLICVGTSGHADLALG